MGCISIGVPENKVNELRSSAILLFYIKILQCKL